MKISLQSKPENISEGNALTIESFVQRHSSHEVEETTGVLSMVLIFTLCYVPRMFLLVYETVNNTWIQENSTTCMVPLALFYGKAIYNLLITLNASISIYVYFLVKNKLS